MVILIDGSLNYFYIILVIVMMVVIMSGDCNDTNNLSRYDYYINR